MDQELQVALCNIEVASQIQVYLLNSRQKDDSVVKKAAILKDVKILAQYINEQCKTLSSKCNICEAVAVSNTIDPPTQQEIEIKNDDHPESDYHDLFSPPVEARRAEPIEPSTPTKNTVIENVPETPSANNISGFDRLVAKILSPAPASALRTPSAPANESILPAKPTKIMPSFSLFNDEAVDSSNNNNKRTLIAADDNLLGLSTNHSITFNMSRPLSPIIGNTFGTPQRRVEAARMSGRLSGRYASVNNMAHGDGAEDDVFGSLTLTSVGDWAKLREYLKTQDVKTDQPLHDEPTATKEEDIDVKDIAGAENLDSMAEKRTGTMPLVSAELTTPSRPYEPSGLLESSAGLGDVSEVLVTPQAAAPPSAVETEKLYPTPGRRKGPQPVTEVIKLVTPTKGGAGSESSQLPTRTMAVTPSIKASFATKSTSSSAAHTQGSKFSTPVKSSSGNSHGEAPRTPSTAVLHHESSIVTPSRSAMNTPSGAWGTIHARNPASKTPPNKMDLRKVGCTLVKWDYSNTVLF